MAIQGNEHSPTNRQPADRISQSGEALDIISYAPFSHFE